MPLLWQPLISQWGQQANARRTDCGVACVAMLLETYGRRGSLTVDDLALQTTLESADVGLQPEQLVQLAERHGLRTYMRSDTQASDIRASIDAGHPVIALIAYRYILNRLDQGDNVPGRDGHFIVIVGYDDTHWIANDPDYWVPHVEQGHDVLIPITQLDQALSGNGYGRKCIFVDKETDVATQPELDALLAALMKTEADVQAAIAQVRAMSPNAGPVPPTTTKVMYVISQQGANVRSGADVGYGKVGVVKYLTPVTVQVPAVNGWYQLAAGDPVGGYISGTLLSDGG